MLPTEKLYTVERNSSEWQKTSLPRGGGGRKCERDLTHDLNGGTKTPVCFSSCRRFKHCRLVGFCNHASPTATHTCLTKYSVQWPNRSTLPLNTTWAVCVCWWSFTAKKLKWKVCLVLKINRFVRLILLKVTKYKKFVLLIFILDFRNRFKEIWREHISLICRLNEHQKSFRLLLSCLQSEKFNQL